MEKLMIGELIKFSKTLNVLYVEDNKDAQVQTLKLLDNFFGNVTLAVDGNDGLEKYNKNQYDLIITDINMPNKNGIDMITDIKAKDSEVFCLIISAYDESEYFIKAIELGVDGFLLKPVKLEQFTQLIFKTIKRIKNYKDVKDLNEKQARLSSLGEMMDAIAHQWKQPLNTITMAASNLNMEIENGMVISTEEIKGSCTDVMIQSKHIVDTLDDFRSFFRPITNKKNTSVKKLIRSVLNLMKNTLMKKYIVVNVNCDETINIDVIENEFKHVFINLINNTKDAYSTFDKDIEKVINIDVYKTEDKVIIEFKDKAGGIPQDIINNIFESNFTTKENGMGTGIGLYMTNQIVEKAGGTIEAINFEDGACFRIIV